MYHVSYFISYVYYTIHVVILQTLASPWIFATPFFFLINDLHDAIIGSI